METSSRILLTFLLNACWQIALIAAVAAFCDWLLRESAARYRNWLWVAALFLSICLPALSSSRVLEGALSRGHLNLPAQPQATAQPVAAIPIPLPAEMASDETAALPTRLPFSQKRTSALISVNQGLAAALVALYLLFLCYRGLRLLNAWRKTQLISRSAYAVDFTEHIQTTIRQCQNTIGVTRVRILCSASIAVPVTVGTLKPLIILPERLSQEADANVLITAIGHELVHIRRHDYLLNLIYELLYLPLSFHPAAWLVRRRINQTRELGCDELVTEKLIAPEVYARSLVQLAGAAIPLRRSTTTITVGIADADILEERVMTMLKRSKPNVGRKSWLLIAATLCFAVPCLAAAPFALRININPQASAASARDVVAVPLKNAVLPQQDAQQEAKQAKENAELEAKLKAERERVASREGKVEFQGQVYEVRLRDGQEIRNVTLQQEPSQEAREKKERVEQMVKEAIEKNPSLDAKIIKAKIEQMLTHERMKERALAEQEMQNPEMIAHHRAEREAMAKRQAELAKQANISMQQAIQIATNQYPGTVLESRLVRERDQACYVLAILSDNGTETATTLVIVSAIDGSVIKAVKENR